MHVLGSKSLGAGTVGNDRGTANLLLPSSVAAMSARRSRTDERTTRRVEVTPEEFASWATSGSLTARMTAAERGTNFGVAKFRPDVGGGGGGGGGGGAEASWSATSMPGHDDGGRPPSARPRPSFSSSSARAAAGGTTRITHTAGPGPEAIEVQQHRLPCIPAGAIVSMDASVPSRDRPTRRSSSRHEQQVRSVELLQEWKCNVRNTIVHCVGRSRSRSREGVRKCGGGGGGGASRQQHQSQQYRNRRRLHRQQQQQQQQQSTAGEHQQRPARSKPKQKPKRAWRQAVDPKSGRTYYYDAITRETQWRKPVELATDEERRAIAEKERRQRDFFSAMEANILESMARGSLLPGGGTACKKEEGEEEREGLAEMKSSVGGSSVMTTAAQVGGGGSSGCSGGEKKSMGLLPKLLKPTNKPVRTISSMDDALLAELAKTGGGKSQSGAGNGSAGSGSSPDVVSGFPYPANNNGSSLAYSFSDGGGDQQQTPLASHLQASFPPPGKQKGSSSASSSSSSSSATSLTRTGSGERRAMEDRAIAQVRRTAYEIAALDAGGASSSTTTTPASSASSPDEATNREASTPAPSDLRKIARPVLQQRNTCGTLYVSSTMSDPDKDATIRCVCGVYRAHMLQAAREEAATGFGPTVKFDEYEIFNDLPGQRGRGLGNEISISPDNNAATPMTKPRSSDDSRNELAPAGGGAPSSTMGSDVVVVSHSPSSSAEDLSVEALFLASIEGAVPSLEDITSFYRDVFRRSQMEADCIIMSLIYIERLIKETNGGVRPRIGNWRSVLFASMVMSSKVWDDLSMWNADFSQTCPAGVRFPLKRINELELAMLNCLKFNVKVPASEYAKYYFLLRSMCIRSGLAGQDLMSMSPLDVEGAKKLEHMSSAFQGNSAAGKKAELTKLKLGNRRSKSTGEVERMSSPTTAWGGGTSTSPTGAAKKVNLEEVVQM